VNPDCAAAGGRSDSCVVIGGVNDNPGLYPVSGDFRTIALVAAPENRYGLSDAGAASSALK